MSICPCLGSRRPNLNNSQQSLLPLYEHDTDREQRLHEKLHSYQMLRAMTQGFMPSNEQLIVNLRTLLASDFLNPEDSSLSDSGRLLMKHTKQLILSLIDTFQHKNSSDELQDLIWFLTRSRVTLDTTDIVNRATRAKRKANTAAAYESARTVGTLLLQSSDFRLFLGDLQMIGKEVFRDSAYTASKVAEDAGERVAPKSLPPDEGAVAQADAQDPPTKQELAGSLQEVKHTLGQGAAQVGSRTIQSTAEHVTKDDRRILVQRLRAAVSNLRQRPNYTDSVSTLTLLLQRYLFVYSRMVSNTINVIEDDTHENQEMDEALKDLGTLLQRFGDPKEWKILQEKFTKLLNERKESPDLEKLNHDIAEAVNRMLTDPAFYDGDNAKQEVQRIRDDSRMSKHGSSFSDDVEGVLHQIRRTAYSVYTDKDVASVLTPAHKILDIFSPENAYINKDLLHDALNVFIPRLINAIQYLPIPRLELAVPELDLLLENLILEPGVTVNGTSFLPFRFRVESYNAVELRKTVTNTVSSTTSLFTVKIDGLSLRADDLGYWINTHSGLLRFVDEGLASFHLDERGIDIHLDVEVGKDRLESILSLKAVRVRIHHLDFTLRKSKMSFLATLAKPLLRPIIRKTIESQLANAIADFFHAANRELLFARERLRATRIADPDDLMTFFKAVAARLKPADDPDVYVRLGVQQPGQGVFKGRYAPGSMAKLWEEEGRRARERIDDFEKGGWRNGIFDLKVAAVNGERA
ncbi:MAG: hypothetical protein Q9162_004229 [Coniocarpon cinnabarinum]